MLKLLQNKNTQLSFDTTHGTVWNRWPLHACGEIGKHNHFHPISHVFASSETTASRTFLLEKNLHSHERMFWGESPHVEFTMHDNSDTLFGGIEKMFPNAFHVNCFAPLASVNIPKHTNNCTQV